MVAVVDGCVQYIHVHVLEYHVCLGSVIIATRYRHQVSLWIYLLPDWASAAGYRSVNREYGLFTVRSA